MQSRIVTGLILILGALAMIGGIAAHPHHGHAEIDGGTPWQHIVVAVIVMSSFVILGVGLLRLLRMSVSQLTSDLARVVLTLAGACGSLAAVTGHVVVPRFTEGIGGKADQEIVAVFVTHDSILSAALAQVMIVAWAISALSLSISMLQSGLVGKAISLGGVLLGLLLLSLLVTGCFSITLNNVGLVVLASGIWLIAIGSSLCVNKSMALLEGK